MKNDDKFTDIGVNFAAWTKAVENSRDNLFCYIIWHPEKDSEGNFKMKTIGKMVNDYLTPEGLLDIILYASCEKTADGKMDYFFVTNNDGTFPARTAPGMFDTLKIPNDLGLVRSKIEEYYN